MPITQRKFMLNFTFFTIFLVLPNIYNSRSYCGSYLPLDRSSCHNYSSDKVYCCHLSTYTNDLHSSLCYPIKIDEYINLNNKINLNGFDYELDCGIQLGTTCGDVSTPISYLDCSQFSSNSNTCCFYDYRDKRKCVWLDSSKKGVIEYNGLKIICSGSKIKYKIFSLEFFITFSLLLLSILI
jgi:hypothetical protein